MKDKTNENQLDLLLLHIKLRRKTIKGDNFYTESSIFL